MSYLADLHVHSPFSLATSRNATLANLASWAVVKGIDLVGTGDFTHPGWLAILKKELQPAEPGFFRLRNADYPPALPGLKRFSASPRFLLSAEISCVYRKDGRVHKIHCLVLLPDLDCVKRFNRRLVPFGNLASDGRPTLRLDARDLLEIVLEETPQGFLVPAHIWTPWFSLFGARSGFDSVEECFGDLSDNIFALETGLSSDPAMNRLLSALDRFSLISNSDCHSPAKLGREANILATSFDFHSLREGLKPGNTGLRGTIEFYPQEGKYYADGHRRCGIRSDQPNDITGTTICPVCQKPLTIGVEHRVRELADRSESAAPPHSPVSHHLVGLQEIIAEITGRGVNTKTVKSFYAAAINHLGPELPLLLHAAVEEIADFSELLGIAIDRLRRSHVTKESGYDGRPGRILLFSEKERRNLKPPYFSWQNTDNFLS